jgi:membrane fusion protein, multidrug efflux system
MSTAKLLAAALIAATAACAQQTVDAVRVVSRTVERNVTLPGEFAPYLAVDVYARVNGFIEKIAVDRGSVVKEGDLLITLAAPELAAQSAEARSRIQTMESQRAEAEARLAAAQSTWERMKAAAATPGAVAQNEVIAAEKTAEAARAAVEAARNSVRAASAAARSIEDMEAYLRVSAPFDGMVTARLVHPGALVGPSGGPASTPMLRLEQNSRLRLIVAVPEADAGGVAQGASVPFSVPAWPGETFRGAVVRIAHSLDVKTRTMPVELDVLNPGLRLAPGMYARVEWPVRRAHASLLVPASSIVATNERQFVVRLNSGVAEWINVTRGASTGGLVEVLGPLGPGDLIARRGSDEIREGARVQSRFAEK